MNVSQKAKNSKQLPLVTSYWIVCWLPA
uniref:Uncharacterized protein n=1 Tax=Arundo donax TaxID=35708 RepID=A0A0A8ZL64_ARUDO